MAIIKCPECERDISDKAKKCPYCAKVFEEDVPLIKEIKCTECGAALSETDETCPSCGCPIEKESDIPKEKLQEVQLSSIKVTNKMKIGIISVIIILVVCVAGGIGYNIYSRYKAKQEYQTSYNKYIDNMRKAEKLMLSGGGDAETLSSLTANVWRNAIFKEDDAKTNKYTKTGGVFVSDFNTALENLSTDSDTETKISDIEENQEAVKKVMKELKDVPKGLDKCYDTILELDKAYSDLTDLAISPKGSYKDFTTNENDSDAEFMSAYHKLETQIPDKINTHK